ncbi:hypothetical protein PL321_08560 [Caloramator sp. mosi_1]|nr:hypothetical protein [Caloramator sp. mosi_1]WDC85391.1 hypothetical protein PL321_08560 [Caloramator sp. mosi_1]
MFLLFNKKIDKALKEYITITSKRRIPVIVCYKKILNLQKVPS